ncbi:MAG: outer membrane beta-barrel protein, partial [Bacteroidales bacterium]|nr:outer membrane beta-barrel protein [Bacteroidales bacterium]
MKKIILLSLMTVLLIPAARSQVLIALFFGDKLNTPNIEFGLNVGGNFTTLTNYPEAKFLTGLNFGLYFNFKLSDHFYLHPEMLFINQMGSKGLNNRDLPHPELQHETLETWMESNYFTLVFLPRYKLTNQLYFEAGIHFSYLLSADDY